MKENVEIHCDSEIASIVKEKGIVSSVLCSGSKNKQKYECDALIMCNGPNTSQFLSKFLGYSLPVIPLKQYSVTFDSDV